MARKNKGDLYDTLGVPRDVSEADLKQAFRAAAKKAHPDAGGTAEEFERVKTAQVVLSNREKRAKYDETGDIGDEQGPTIEQLAMAILARVFMAAVNEDPDPLIATNLIDMMVMFINKQLEEPEKTLKQMTRARTRAEKLLKKFKRKTKGENVVGKMLQAQIDHMSRTIPQIELNIAANKCAIAILKDYTFEADPTVNISMQMGGTGQLHGSFIRIG